ncbi:hypothetical protein HZ326_23348 [Fusarium oxysporum f. sp. albedinis]|nr:hypothetical protein HZ326_23348 [Fusarium oxysporum f. sp. albedinis]
MVVFVACSRVSTNGRRPIRRSMLSLVGVWDTRPSRNQMSNRAKSNCAPTVGTLTAYNLHQPLGIARVSRTIHFSQKPGTHLENLLEAARENPLLAQV